jgi:hypothetical protein
MKQRKGSPSGLGLGLIPVDEVVGLVLGVHPRNRLLHLSGPLGHVELHSVSIFVVLEHVLRVFLVPVSFLLGCVLGVFLRYYVMILQGL